MGKAKRAHHGPQRGRLSRLACFRIWRSFKVQRRNTTVILKVLARLGPRKERGHLQDDHSSCGAVNMIRIKETLVCLPMDREGYHIGGQSCYRALSSLLRASGSLHPSVKSNDCWNRMASAVELPAGTVPSI